MDNSLRITMVANAGLLLEYKGTALLLDAVYGDTKGYPFSPLPEDVWQKMKAGQPPFDKVDFLLFTHVHPDHFSPEVAVEYLRERTVKGVFMPDVREVAESGLPELLAQRKIPCAMLSKYTDHTAVRVTPEITVRAFKTRHLDKKFEHVEHFCYLLTFGDKNVLFTSDVDYVAETLEQVRDIRLDGVFVNPLFFGALRRGRFFRGKLDTKRVIVYHIPFPQDDVLHMREVLMQDVDQWPRDRAWVTVLQDTYQKISL